MKSARSWGVAGIVIALLVHLGVTMPARGSAAQAAERYQRLRRERQDAERRLADLEKRASLLASASSSVTASAGTSGEETLQKIRAGVVRSLRDVGIDRVRLEVRPAAAPVIAGLSLQADAKFQPLLRLIAHVVRPGSGLVLQRVSLSVSATGLTLLLEAAALSGGA